MLTIDRVDGAGSGWCCRRAVPNPAVGIRQDGGQRDQVGVGGDLRVDVGLGGRWGERTRAACPAAVDPRGIPNREARGVVVAVMQSCVALRNGIPRGRGL